LAKATAVTSLVFAGMVDSIWTRFMGTLGNQDHERFCLAYHKRVWAGERAVDARVAAYRDVIFRGDNPESRAIKDNARKLVQQKAIRERLAELRDQSAKTAGLDAAFVLIRAMRIIDDAYAFNLGDFLKADESGNYSFDLSKVPRGKLALLTELSIDGNKVRIKGPNRAQDTLGALDRICRVLGLDAPKKIAPTTPEGKAITLGDLVGSSMLLQPVKPTHGASPTPENADGIERGSD
jgi:hypothetical protein